VWVGKEAIFLNHISNMEFLKIVNLADELGLDCHNVTILNIDSSYDLLKSIILAILIHFSLVCK
jgi:hypothetical protein